MANTLTILVPTHNRPNVFALAWPTWLRQDGISEIVVVNDGSSESYDAVFDELRAACKVASVILKIINLPTRLGAPAAKNKGLLECSSDEVLTTDDDILLTNDMVAQCRLARPLMPCPVIVGPRVIYLKDDEKFANALERSAQENKPYFDYKKLVLCAWAHPGSVREYPFVTAVAVWPTVLFRNGLRFYEGYGGNGYREESDPQLMAAMRFGAKVFLTPDAHCFHLSPSVAYAQKSGQRRGGLFWFEYWVLRNNLIFLCRFSSFISHKFKVNPILSWLALLSSRFSVNRFVRKFIFGS